MKFSFEKPDLHPFDLVFMPPNAKFLVIGSFPTTESKMAFKFFYPNANNKFWKVLDSVFSESKVKPQLKVSVKDDIKTKDSNKLDRQNFCIENRIAMTDILKSCFRLEGNSKDEKLFVHCYNPIVDLLEKNKTINKIIITGKSSGSSAHHHFYQYLVMNDYPFKVEQNGNIWSGELNLGNRKIKVDSLPSTSSRGNRIKENELIELYKTAFVS